MSKIRSLPLNEHSWVYLRQAEARKPHEPKEMTLVQPHGPILMWACYEPFCGETAFSYSSKTSAPVCSGGLKWSFMTTSGFDPRIHDGRALS